MHKLHCKTSFWAEDMPLMGMETCFPVLNFTVINHWAHAELEEMRKDKSLTLGKALCLMDRWVRARRASTEDDRLIAAVLIPKQDMLGMGLKLSQENSGSGQKWCKVASSFARICASKMEAACMEVEIDWGIVRDVIFKNLKFGRQELYSLWLSYCGKWFLDMTSRKSERIEKRVNDMLVPLRCNGHMDPHHHCICALIHEKHFQNIIYQVACYEVLQEKGVLLFNHSVNPITNQ